MRYTVKCPYCKPTGTVSHTFNIDNNPIKVSASSTIMLTCPETGKAFTITQTNKKNGVKKKHF